MCLRYTLCDDRQFYSIFMILFSLSKRLKRIWKCFFFCFLLTHHYLHVTYSCEPPSNVLCKHVFEVSEDIIIIFVNVRAVAREWMCVVVQVINCKKCPFDTQTKIQFQQQRNGRKRERKRSISMDENHLSICCGFYSEYFKISVGFWCAKQWQVSHQQQHREKRNHIKYATLKWTEKAYSMIHFCMRFFVLVSVCAFSNKCVRKSECEYLWTGTFLSLDD